MQRKFNVDDIYDLCTEAKLAALRIQEYQKEVGTASKNYWWCAVHWEDTLTRLAKLLSFLEEESASDLVSVSDEEFSFLTDLIDRGEEITQKEEAEIENVLRDHPEINYKLKN